MMPDHGLKSGGGESRFLPNTVALIVQTIVATLITLAQVKLLSNFLPQDQFGLFASLRGFSLLISTTAANGLPALLVRYVPVHETNGHRREALRLSALCVVGSLLVLGFLGVVVLALRTQLLAFTDAETFRPEFYVWFLATTLGVMLKIVIYGGLNGLRRLTLQLLVETATLLAVLVWIFLSRNNLSIILLFRILGILHVVSVAIALPIYFLLLTRIHPEPAPENRASMVSPSVGDYRSYLTWATALSIVAIAFSDVDRYLLAQVLSLEFLALFHIGARIGRLANRMLGVSNLAFQPEVSRLDAEGRGAGVLNVTQVFMKLNVALAVLAALVLAAFAKEIIVLVASTEYVAAAPLLMILAASLPLTTLAAPIAGVMKALDQVRGAFVTDVVWAIIYIGLMFPLGRAFGLIGVGVAHFLACTCQLVTAVRVCRIVPGHFVITVLVRVLTVGLVFLPVFAVDMVVERDPPRTLLKLVFVAAGCFGFHRILRASVFLTAEERRVVVGTLKRYGLRALARLL